MSPVVRRPATGTDAGQLGAADRQEAGRRERRAPPDNFRGAAARQREHSFAVVAAGGAADETFGETGDALKRPLRDRHRRAAEHDEGDDADLDRQLGARLGHRGAEDAAELSQRLL